MKIIKNFENGQTLTSLSREFDLASTTAPAIFKGRERIKNHVEVSLSLKSTISKKKRAGALFQVQNFLKLWMENKVQKCSA
jgi:hypothetical protein